ncbi:unnamed protein product [Ilex paraguariensis]|uniref:RING-type E3 ubiquitin transferase n=1 Tax=Ilex paraguariensis TaxID=185542 RepID=A0ABC8V5R7_9AQUA
MEEEKHHHWLEVSPLIIGLIGVMAGALIIAIFQCIISCCSNNHTAQLQINVRTSDDQVETPPSSSSNSNSNNSTVQLIGSCRYSEEYCKEETVCTVCLVEFKEGGEVCILPECTHTFHVACIDKWLHSHPNCPLCRAHTMPRPPVVALPDSGGGVLPSELYGLPDFGG